MRFSFSFFILFICSSSLNAQTNNFKNLKSFLKEQNLFDYGYDLQKDDSRQDSIVCYNDFVSDKIFFNEINSNIEFNSNDSIFKVKLNNKRNVLKYISINFKNSIIRSLQINDSLNNFTRIVTSYNLKFNNDNYILFYLSDDNLIPSLRENYLGVLIDTKTKLVSLFPTLQHTSSILPLTDIDNDGELDYVSYYPSFKDTVTVYTINFNCEWIPKKDYSCKLNEYDGFVWLINFNSDNFLKYFYNLKK